MSRRTRPPGLHPSSPNRWAIGVDHPDNFYPYPEEYYPGITGGPLPDDHRTHLRRYFIEYQHEGCAYMVGKFTPILWDVFEYRPRFRDKRSVTICETSKFGIEILYRWEYGKERWVNIQKGKTVSQGITN